MIIRRYLSGQLLITTIAVTSLLTLILMGGRVIKFFGMAAEGRLDVNLLSAVLLYRLPGFLELIIPLSLFIAVLLVFGRLYIDNEMAVLSSSGISRWQLIGSLVPVVLLITVTVASLSLYFTPKGNYLYEKVFSQQANRNAFDMVKVGQFQKIDSHMLYANAMSTDKSQLLDVTLYSEKQREHGTSQIMLFAKTATRQIDANTGRQTLILTDGYRYELVAGQIAYNRLAFKNYQMRLRFEVQEPEITKIRAFSTPDIQQRIQQGDKIALGEWLWRCSMPLLAPTGLLLAIALSKVNPRQGRYLKLLPAILLYISLVVLIGATRNKIAKGKMAEIGLWSVHIFYFGLGILLLSWDDIKLRYQAWRDAKGAAV
ncbi:MAG TPA: LPS export ABC transporter permease LptF [Agitococcus sp.]|uniref:LPS export ABC transporter permease LptF n=1 Tax=uncultured Agitococcus sp. TaxID=1506599 RepID=UPI002601E8F9|nr:LPS export ABC transporter permease LptF [uncultured Agitococcus sp.]HMY27452.1 LPS export ABC transporter permease LptF [Agitococcus sp.]HMY81644.1 LPS export ABC transporter permease LptF [Agitococcus sp.]HNC85711.1 LPS export ABC transporter permease LptF [Agitococcus sp.]HNG46356.1 LPS export ABC transporter permease LptF [Agitococcus sp.]HNL36970.1 LPS export ABC transporter permease LptF [Agitococcus sp.]